MVRVRHLSNAPIVEAIVDFRVRLPVNFDVKKEYYPLRKELASKYVKVEKGTQITGSIEIEGGKPKIQKSGRSKISGYRFTSRDAKEVVQFRIDGFTYSRLNPYTKWELVIEEAKKLWDLYRSRSHDLVIERISVHYINQIDIPINDELEDYFTSSPKLPKKLPQVFNHFFSSLGFKEKSLNAMVIQTGVESSKEGHVGVILDIEVFKKSNKGINEKSVWTNINKMRELKNRIFFEMINEKTVRLYL